MRTFAAAAGNAVPTSTDPARLSARTAGMMRACPMRMASSIKRLPRRPPVSLESPGVCGLVKLRL